MFQTVPNKIIRLQMKGADIIPWFWWEQEVIWVIDGDRSKTWVLQEVCYFLLSKQLFLFCFVFPPNKSKWHFKKKIFFFFFSEYFSNEESRITFIYSKHLVKKDRHRLWKSTSVSEKWIFILSDYFSKPKETASQCRQVVKENLFTQDWGQINIIQLTKIWCLPHLESRWDTL